MLLIDTDSQSNLTNSIIDKDDIKHDFYDVMTSKIDINESILSTKETLLNSAIDLIPNTIKSCILDIELTSSIAREQILKNKIKDKLYVVYLLIIIIAIIVF